MTTVGANRYSLGGRVEGDRLAVLRFALNLAEPGCGVEFGVAKGESLSLIANRMPAVGFDSFQGLPADWRPGFGVGRFACKQPVVAGATIVAGLFEDTLPRFDFAALGRISLVHVDCDLYSSTQTALRWIGPHLSAGTVVVFDEWHGYLGCDLHEQRAFREYVEATPGLAWRVLGHGEQQWAIRIT